MPATSHDKRLAVSLLGSSGLTTFSQLGGRRRPLAPAAEENGYEASQARLPNTFLGLFSTLEMGVLDGQPTQFPNKIKLFFLDSSLLSGYKPNAINHKM